MNEAIRPDVDNQAQEGPELSVIVPTFNERDNVTVLYRRLEATARQRRLGGRVRRRQFP